MLWGFFPTAQSYLRITGIPKAVHLVELGTYFKEKNQ